MQTVLPLEPGQYYHIFDRGVNRSNISLEDRNYAYFMQLYAKYITPVAETYAYCLLRNHFHLLVRIRTHRVEGEGDRLGLRDRAGRDARRDGNQLGFKDGVGLEELDRRAVSQAFNNLLNAYAKAINKAWGRTGGLFQRHMSRLPVTSDRYYAALVQYIHHNPQKHGFVDDFREWPYSSFQALLSDTPTRLERAMVLDWFGGPQGLRQSHTQPLEESSISGLVGEDG